MHVALAALQHVVARSSLAPLRRMPRWRCRRPDALYARRFESQADAPAQQDARQPDALNASRFESQTDASVPQDARSKVQLRPYQEDCIQSVLEYIAKGEKRLGISLATGSGKTVIFSHLIERVPVPVPGATRTLILAHRQELVEQAAKQCRELYPDKLVEVEMAKQQASSFADITVASVATLSRSPQRLARFDPGRFKLVLVDEAHHIVARSYMDVLDHFKLGPQGERGHSALVGVSATLSRHDGLKLGTAIDHIVYHRDYVEMIQDEWLSNVIFTTVRSGVNLSKVKVSAGDFQTGALSGVVNTPEANTITVRAWLEKARQRKSTLVFCVDLDHVANLTDMFRQHGVDARYITSHTPMAQRIERLAMFRAGEYPVLVNCGIFTEGTDIPSIDCVVLARPTKSRNLLVQMIGRGMRKIEGKRNCHVIDLVASLQTGIVTTPTLFGLDPDALVEAADLGEMQRLCQELKIQMASKSKQEEEEKKEKEREEREKEEEEKKKKEEEEKKKKEEEQDRSFVPSGPVEDIEVTFTDYDSILELIQDTSGERHIRRISSYAWVQVDADAFVVSNQKGSFIKIKREGKIYSISYTPKLPVFAFARDRHGLQAGSPFGHTRRLGEATTFEAAVRAGDAAASDLFPRDFILTAARWRRTSASPGQVAFLSRFQTQEKTKLEDGFISKGQAADWITKLKHGARSRFHRLAEQKKKTMKKAQVPVENKGKQGKDEEGNWQRKTVKTNVGQGWWL